MLDNNKINSIGFAKVGKNVHISEYARFYGSERIHIGNNVRIDDFCVLSAGAGGIWVGNYVHVALYTSLVGQGRIYISDYCNLSSRVSIFSSNDDYSGITLTNPMIPDAFKNVDHSEVKLGKHVIIGCGSVVLPGVVLEDGVAIGALSLVKEDCKAFGIYAGNPVRRIGERSQEMLKLEVCLVSRKKN